MVMTRDTYAKELIRVAEAAFIKNETSVCPHQDCEEHLSVVKQNTFSTRSLFCPVHGRIFQEQELHPYGELDWDHVEVDPDEYEDSNMEDGSNEDFEDEYPL